MTKMIKFRSRLIKLAVTATSVFALNALPTFAEEALPGGNNTVDIQTNLGDFSLSLDAEKAPVTVKNFLHYVDAGFYNNVIFHRVIPNFMIQGGGFQPGMKKKATDAPIKNESANGLLNVRGSISMARMQNPDSATSQFFISVVDNQSLDPRPNSAGYAVFGHVSEGMDVVDKIVNSERTVKGSYRDVPVEDVIMISVKRSTVNAAPAKNASSTQPM